MSESENRETIAEIVAEMREKSAEYDRLCREHQDFKEQVLMRDWWHNNVVTFRTIADRIEAAWKRELQKLNEANASMRTCLVNIFTEMLDMSGIEAWRKIKFSPDAIVDEIRSALAVADGGAE